MPIFGVAAPWLVGIALLDINEGKITSIGATVFAAVSIAISYGIFRYVKNN